ncbi:cyclin-like protein [Delphinella strobiligena]|nr:cyclin-like protein [Delphinella strobiligena]
MPPPSATAHLPPSQPAARQRPKSPDGVLAEAEAQWLFTEEELAHTPSIQDGMSAEKEKEVRTKGINFIRQVGVMLKLPELTLSTAAIFFNRFLMRMTLVDRPGAKALHHYTLGATALFLATKVEESCRKMKDIVVACCRVAQKNPNLIVDEQSKDFWKWRDTILQNEDVLLETLCFDLTIEPPHKQLYEMLKYYGVHHNKQLRNAAWAFVTDSNQTQLCLLCPSRTIAAAALYCAARYANIAFPDTRGLPWWEMQHVRLKDMLKACNYMAANYEHAPGKTGPDGGQSIYAISSPHAPLLDLERSRRTSAASSQGAKRPYGPVLHQTGEPDVKKRRLSPPPPSDAAHSSQPETTHNHLPVPTQANNEAAGDDGSEEGEVEE